MATVILVFDANRQVRFVPTQSAFLALLTKKCSADFSSKCLIALIVTIDSAQVGLARAGIELESHGVYPRLYPRPWVGPIKSARAFLLQLNPGFSGPEIEIEHSDSDFRKALRDNLGGELPNLFLDSRFTRHPGRRWVESHLRGIAPLERLAAGIAQIEIFPYHSKSFTFPARIARALLLLPSVQVIRKWVHRALVPAAERGDVANVVQRSSKHWGLAGNHETEFLVVYRGGECQGGWMTPKTRGGQLLMRQLAKQGVAEIH